MITALFLSNLSLDTRGGTSMKRQNVHAFRSLYRINANNRRLAGELDCRDDRVKLGDVEIALELLSRIPVFDEQ